MAKQQPTDDRAEELLSAIEGYIDVKLEELKATHLSSPNDSMAGFWGYDRMKQCRQRLNEAIQSIIKK